MNPEEQFVRRATRGLWGQKKREAQTELRGAIEDKIYRHRLLGLNETEATTAALRDLGSPRAIARELGEVHTLPQTLKVLAFTGVAGLLGLQALAQVAVINSAYSSMDLQTICRPPTAQELAAMPVAQRESLERVLGAPEGAERYQADCRRGLPMNGPVALKVADLLTALRAGGIPVSDQAGATPTTPLSIYGGPKSDIPDATYITRDIQGERYLDSSLIIPFLKQVTSLPLHLDGLTNPVLSVGDVTLQLGTSAAPVQATDLLTFALMSERQTNSALPLPITLAMPGQPKPGGPPSPRLAVLGLDGDLYAVLQNSSRLRGGETDLLSVRSLSGGALDVGLTRQSAPLIVDSVEAMDAATAQGKVAVIVYRFDASDLRSLKLTVLDPGQVKVVNP
ncbi:permease prefix domain 1-containing protein [Deinococcus humi]|uniref:Uncharacterized protein n=1 Tax=Deinococcus humi TaxID=662880 RepID=A0A7W8NDX8_9DEIO|nr:permease prefix domain 1-containing protein [Deinococcus humi]MBB5363704.1 hypothetical protein [Deinococcus humi]GGO29685.1 hypothetical protein GCM10008949_23550 [Deinococcus humi]